MSKMRFFALQELANRRPLEVITPSNKLSDYYGRHVFDRQKKQEYLLSLLNNLLILLTGICICPGSQRIICGKERSAPSC